MCIRIHGDEKKGKGDMKKLIECIVVIVTCAATGLACSALVFLVMSTLMNM